MTTQDAQTTQEGGALGAWIGIDVGGTKIDAVLVDAFGVVLADSRDHTAPSEGVEAVVSRIAALAERLFQAAGPRGVNGIGLGCPGQVDGRAGVVRAAVNLGWQDVPLRHLLASRLGHAEVPIALANDVNALALGEVRFGAARALRDVVYLAMGTGLGGAAVVDGALLTGDNNFAMEVGHIVLRPNERLCGCGLRGCAEAYASGVGIMSGIQENMNRFPGSALLQEMTLTMPTVLRAARLGDPLAELVLKDAGEMLGTVMALCAGTLNPQAFVIGGGLGKAGRDLLLPHAEAVFRARVLPPAQQRVQVILASVERAAIGAASLAMA